MQDTVNILLEITSWGQEGDTSSPVSCYFISTDKVWRSWVESVDNTIYVFVCELIAALQYVHNIALMELQIARY